MNADDRAYQEYLDEHAYQTYLNEEKSGHKYGLTGDKKRSISIRGMPREVGGFAYPEIEAAHIGARKTMDDIGYGLADMAEGAVNMLPLDEPVDFIDETQMKADQEVYTALSDEFPIATGVGEAIPYAATVPFSGGLITQAVIGAGLGALEYDAEGNYGENALIGGGVGLAGGVFGKIADRVVRGIVGASKRAAPIRYVKKGDAKNPNLPRKDAVVELTDAQKLDAAIIRAKLKNAPEGAPPYRPIPEAPGTYHDKSGFVKKESESIEGMILDALPDNEKTIGRAVVKSLLAPISGNYDKSGMIGSAVSRPLLSEPYAEE